MDEEKKVAFGKRKKSGNIRQRKKEEGDDDEDVGTADDDIARKLQDVKNEQLHRKRYDFVKAYFIVLKNV
jgi:hypothetical protein